MDGPANSPPYELIEDEVYAAQAKALGIEIRELDTILLDLTWTIARIPQEFPRVTDTIIRRAIYDGNPRLRLWFSFDGNRVMLRAIEKYGPNET